MLHTPSIRVTECRESTVSFSKLYLTQKVTQQLLFCSFCFLCLLLFFVVVVVVVSLLLQLKKIRNRVDCRRSEKKEFWCSDRGQSRTHPSGSTQLVGAK